MVDTLHFLHFLECRVYEQGAVVLSGKEAKLLSGLTLPRIRTQLFVGDPSRPSTRLSAYNAPTVSSVIVDMPLLEVNPLC